MTKLASAFDEPYPGGIIAPSLLYHDLLGRIVDTFPSPDSITKILIEIDSEMLRREGGPT